MYLLRYYDGVWHVRQVRSKDRAYAIFDEKKAAGAKRVEVYRLDRLFDFWDDVVFKGIVRDEVKSAMNAIYGEGVYEDPVERRNITDEEKI